MRRNMNFEADTVVVTVLGMLVIVAVSILAGWLWSF
jgi:hypothetical protein